MHHYPFQSEIYFPRNVWYIGAKSDEVGEALLVRTFFDERVLLYRKMDGEVTALSGLCPHRFLPLEHGVRIGDKVQCGYHGFTFDETGACVRIPSQGEVPNRCHLRTYPTQEAGGFVWIWMGDPAGAGEALLPDLEAAGLQGPGWKVTPSKVWHIEGRAQLVIDSLHRLGDLLEDRVRDREDFANGHDCEVSAPNPSVKVGLCRGLSRPRPRPGFAAPGLALRRPPAWPAGGRRFRWGRARGSPGPHDRPSGPRNAGPGSAPAR